MINGVSNTVNYDVLSTARKNTAGSVSQSGKAFPVSSAADTASISGEGKLRNIMSRYDVQNMSYNEQKQMSEELYKNGLVNDSDYIHMTKPPGDFSAITGQPKPDHNEKKNIVEYYENKLEFMKSISHEDKSIKFVENMLSVYKNLEQYQS